MYTPNPKKNWGYKGCIWACMKHVAGTGKTGLECFHGTKLHSLMVNESITIPAQFRDLASAQ